MVPWPVALIVCECAWVVSEMARACTCCWEASGVPGTAVIAKVFCKRLLWGVSVTVAEVAGPDCAGPVEPFPDLPKDARRPGAAKVTPPKTSARATSAATASKASRHLPRRRREPPALGITGSAPVVAVGGVGPVDPAAPANTPAPRTRVGAKFGSVGALKPGKGGAAGPDIPGEASVTGVTGACIIDGGMVMGGENWLLVLVRASSGAPLSDGEIGRASCR